MGKLEGVKLILVSKISIFGKKKINHQTLKKEVLLYGMVSQPSSNDKLLLMIILHL